MRRARAYLRAARHLRGRRRARSISATRPTHGAVWSANSSATASTLRVAAKAGLVKRGQRGYYDFYRDRLMVPTYSTTGEVIAFGGRAIGDAEPKYLNTSTTPVYTKGHTSSRSTSRAARRRASGRSSSSRAISIASRCIKPASRTRSRRSVRRSRPSKRRSFANTPTTSTFASTATLPGARLQPKRSMSRLKRSSTRDRRSASCCCRPDDDPDTFLAVAAPRRSASCSTRPNPRLQFRIDAEIERLRAGFDSPARAGAESRGAHSRARAARRMGPLARLRRRSPAGERRRPSE